MNPQTGITLLKSPLIRRKSDGFTLLHLFASGDDCVELVAYLINAGIAVDTTNDNGLTPLHEAARGGQLPNCKALLALHANPICHPSKGIHH